MGLFTTRQLLGYTEQKVKFRALFLELFFRRTVNFHTEEVMLDKITGKTPVAAYVSPIVEGKVLRHRGGETRVLRPGYVKPKHEFNYQQAVERLPGEDPAQLNDPAYRRLRIITDNLKQEEHAIVQVEEMQAVNAVLYGKYTMEGEQFDTVEVDFGRSEGNNIEQADGKKWSEQDRDTFDPTHDIDLYCDQASGLVNIAIMDGTVWRLLNGFKLFREKLDTRRGSNSQLETAVKDLGAVVSFKGYYGDLADRGGENVLCGRRRYRKTLSAGGHTGPGEYGSRGHSLLWCHSGCAGVVRRCGGLFPLSETLADCGRSGP